MLNLDTHILIDFLRGRLSDEEHRVVLGDDLAISGIVLWEIAKLVQLRRLTLNLRDPRFLQVLGSLRVIPVDLEVAQMSCQLDFRSDPADEIIAATSIVHDLPLVTRDERIRGSKRLRFPL
ncbi:MAG: type II toxin-antitoxin system VapC family toxin [Bradymonadales bacterium]|nr:type II toxin-antitoxin system VapC family toxin [Bradymonadales bacterium]